jgi:FtsP/CotA-like multicopper oxidase with cupredoxin domain
VRNSFDHLVGKQLHRVGTSSHRHTFEVTKVGDKTTAGVMKDTINMTRFSTVEIDFIADDPGPALLHCHHQDHQDEGFMGLVTYL